MGKTIEAGLILNELLIRRRIRRVLIICPASLRFQWRQEMQEKFSLGFDVIDRAETLDLQKRLGLDTNPWRAYPRVIASYHYLKQQDILNQFRATCQQTGAASAQLPWDLLIVDEAHNLTPSHFGDDSALARMLRIISPQFEHRLFLSAFADRFTDNDQRHQLSAPSAVLGKLTVNVTCIGPFAYRIGRFRGFFRAGYTARPERSGAGLEWE